MQKRQPYEIYEDRRKYPRVVTNSPAEIRFQDKVLSVRVHDLSPDGLQIRCSRPTLREIRPSGRAIKKDNAPVVDVRFRLSVGRAERNIEASATLYYIVLLPERKEADVACGLQFKEFRGKGREHVDAFIADAMAPMESSVPARLPRDGETVAADKGGKGMHLRPGAAMKALLKRTEDLETRVTRLEHDSRRRG